MTIEGAIGKFVTVLIDPLVTLGFAAALLLFFWGLFKMIMALTNGEDPKEGKQHMLWGIIGMTIMFSVGGIISFITGTIGANPADQKIEIRGGFE